MSTATLDQGLKTSPSGDERMVERDRVQDYAEKLRREGRFRAKVLVDMAIEAMHFYGGRLESRLQEQGYTALDRPCFKVTDVSSQEDLVRVGFPINLASVGSNIEKLIGDPFQSQEFWEQNATWIVERLDAQSTKQEPESIDLVWSRSDRTETGEVSREAYLIQLRAFYVAGEWLKQLNLFALSLETLEKLLEGDIGEVTNKLSRLQKEILSTLLENSRSASTLAAVPWQPNKLLPNITKTDRTAVSKSLLRLAERNLIQRLDLEEEVIPTVKEKTPRRTAFVKLTDLGDLVAKLQNGIQAAQ